MIFEYCTPSNYNQVISVFFHNFKFVKSQYKGEFPIRPQKSKTSCTTMANHPAISPPIFQVPFISKHFFLIFLKNFEDWCFWNLSFKASLLVLYGKSIVLVDRLMIVNTINNHVDFKRRCWSVQVALGGFGNGYRNGGVRLRVAQSSSRVASGGSRVKVD